jgi:hypothetical protein
MGTASRLFLILALAPASFASSLCSSGGSLQSYIDLGAGGCQIGNILFNSFTYSYTQPLVVLNPNAPDGNTNPSAAQVIVDIGGSLTAPTLTFIGDWTVGGGYQAQLNIDFTACDLNALGVCTGSPVSSLGAASISFIGSVDDLAYYPSNINANLNVFPEGGNVVTLTPSLYPSACASPPTVCPTETVSTSFGAAQQVSLGNQFTLDSGGHLLPGFTPASPNSAVLTSFSETIVDAPEPSTLAAVGLGILACCVLGLRRFLRIHQPRSH